VETDWTRNALISFGWSNRSEWDTDKSLATPPKDLSGSTDISLVPSLAWAASPPAGYSGWKDYLGVQNDLLSLVGHGHVHNEGSWKLRFPAALRFLFPGKGLQ
jgi:hypothetical protein